MIFWKLSPTVLNDTYFQIGVHAMNQIFILTLPTLAVISLALKQLMAKNCTNIRKFKKKSCWLGLRMVHLSQHSVSQSCQSDVLGKPHKPGG